MYASIAIWIIVTNVAIMTINAGIRILSGMRFLSKEITIFEHIRTNVVARPILIPLRVDVVVPSVGHIPSINTKVGFSLMSPFNMVLK